MLRLVIAEGTKQAIVTLFDATKKIIGCPVTEFIASNKQVCISCFE